MKKKKTVGLILITDTGKAVLQVRGFNTEKNEQETYRGANQLTVHGNIKKGETEREALLRETKEELGGEFAKLLQYQTLEELNKIKNDKISVTNFGFRITEKDLETIKDAKIRLISKDDIVNIRKLKMSDRLSGIASADEIAMFSDDIEALKLAFEKFF